MGLIPNLVAMAIGNSQIKKMEKRMEKRMLEMLNKYKANIDASSEKNLELERWISEHKKI